MGIENNYSLITLLIILGAGVGVMLAWGATNYLIPPRISGPPELSSEQAQYMRAVRLRNLEMLAGEVGREKFLRRSESTV